MPKLLLADDSPTTQKVVQLTFADEGIDVVIADDGDTAMEMFDHHHPDIVLADINIPGLNGYDICEAIRKRGSNGKTPVVLLAGSFEPFDPEAARRVGANDYLTKPFSSIRRLVATVTALLDTVVRADETAHDTVEPDSDEPNSGEPVAIAENLPAPGTKQPEVDEPDMFSTSDIENLYSQSVSDPVEAPSSPSESDSSEPQQSSNDEIVTPPGDDAAFDDELIETTYAGPQTDESEPDPSAVVDQEPSVGSVSAEQIPVPMDDLPAEELSIPQSQIPTVSFESPMDYNEEVRQALSVGQIEVPTVESHENSEIATDESAPIQEFQLDQSADEAYFEPTIEQIDEVTQIEQHEVTAAEPHPKVTPDENLSSSTPAAEVQLSHELSDSASPQTTDASGNNGPIEVAQYTQESPEPIQPSTPWDSKAEPESRPFQLDEPNLLELPVEENSSDSTLKLAANESAASTAAYELTPEIVDQIAKQTATYISEEMIREIAKRVVPKVIEEVLTGQRDERS